jgi:hypothetical protein
MLAGSRLWTALIMATTLLISEGCLDTEGDETLPSTLEDLDGDPLAGGVAPQPSDEAVCRALATRQTECHGGFATMEGCPSRFACSRRLWRPELVEEVYACVETQPCNVVDPAMACLEEIGGELEPTEAQRQAEDALDDLEGQCDGLLEVAPGQSDEVYDVIRSCIEAEEDCDGIGTCVVVSMDALLDDVCRTVETI